jgi:hypothetical protein
MKKGIILFSILSFLFPAAALFGWPRPSLLDKEGSWTLDVQYEHPRMITISAPGTAQPKRFWYLIISLTNNTDQEVPFYPKAELMTDTFQVIPSGCIEQKQLFEEVRRRHRGSYPFLECLDFTDLMIRKGKDNKRDFVLFWPDFDPKANEVKFFIGGLSSESAAVEHPTRKEDSGRPMRIYLQKTLQLNYTIGVDPGLRSRASLNFEGQDWMMR